jgi:hypothetical protein
MIHLGQADKHTPTTSHKRETKEKNREFCEVFIGPPVVATHTFPSTFSHSLLQKTDAQISRDDEDDNNTGVKDHQDSHVCRSIHDVRSDS